MIGPAITITVCVDPGPVLKLAGEYCGVDILWSTALWMYVVPTGAGDWLASTSLSDAYVVAQHVVLGGVQ